MSPQILSNAFPLDQQSSHSNNDISGFSFNHPKNYFGVPIAIAEQNDTDRNIASDLVSMPKRAKRGAADLGLISDDGEELTPVGAEFVANISLHSTYRDELHRLSQLKGSTARFIEQMPRFWYKTVKTALKRWAVAGSVVTTLESLGSVCLAEYVQALLDNNHSLANIFLSNRTVQDRTKMQSTYLHDPQAYRGKAVYQLKNILYHCGILTERGSDTSSLAPLQDTWELESQLFLDNSETMGETQ